MCVCVCVCLCVWYVVCMCEGGVGGAFVVWGVCMWGMHLSVLCVCAAFVGTY